MTAARPRRNWGARVQEHQVSGLSAVTLENERLRVTVLPGKGCDIVEFLDKRRDVDLVWWSPRGLRNPADLVGGAADDAALFHDTYEGGWQDVFPSGGAPCRYRGAALAQHGEVSGQSWAHRVVTDTEDLVEVEFTVHTRRLPYTLSRALRLAAGEATLRVVEHAVNTAPVEVHAMWGQHLAFGAPFLRPGHRIRLPDGVRVLPHAEPVFPPRRRVAPGGPHSWPEVPADGGGTVDLSVVPAAGEPSELCYLTGFTDGWYELVDPRDDAGIRVGWDARVLPYLWLWQELGASTDYPWWGQAYVVGLEPFSSQPTNGLVEAVENGTALRFAPGQRRDLTWSVGLLGGVDDG
ncbi:MAG: DUF4432 family protein [Actinocatenispora sp.]